MEQSKWVSLHAHSEHSLLDGFGNVKDIVQRHKELGYSAAALTDHGSISGLVSFSTECKKQGIKPILGCELYVTEDAKLKTADNKKLSHLVVLCKNLQGWYELISCVSESNKPENFYFKPRVDYDILNKLLGNGNIIAISGHPGSTISDALFDDIAFYRSSTVEEARALLAPNWKERALSVIDKHLEIFGDNLFIEIQLIDKDNMPASVAIAECLREIVAESGGKLRPVATADSHYVNKEDAEYQRILLCSALNRTMPSIERDLKAGKDVPLGIFFISDNYHIPSYEEIAAVNTEEEIANAVLIAEMCEEYEITGPPKLPHFDCGGDDEFEYLRKICLNGWKELIVDKGVLKDEETKNIYIERIKKELGVIKDADLSGYFLIVQDILGFCRKKGWYPTTPGRGSGAGCLTSYLSKIVTIDPIPYDLIFERFYSKSRSIPSVVDFEEYPFSQS